MTKQPQTHHQSATHEVQNRRVRDEDVTQSSQGLGTRGDRGRLEGEKDSAQRDVKHSTDRPREVDLLRDLVHGSEIVDAESKETATSANAD